MLARISSADLVPDERSGVDIDRRDVAGDRRFEFGDCAMDAATDLLFRQIGEEALDLVDPTLDYRLVLHCAAAANDETYERLLVKLIEEYGLENRIILSHDYLTDEEMRALFEESDLSFAISSEDQLTITIFETIIANTNLILNDIKPYRMLEQVIKSKFDLVDVTDIKKLAQKIEDYIRFRKPPAWSKAMQFIKNEYLFDKKTDQYIQIYQNILKAD